MGELLRVATAGSVDDGKSTLIGRLLYDSKNVYADQLDAVWSASRRLGLDASDLALLTDGLRAEREQGITIDVAYRYFATPARSFILADTPGHVQYTRNMVTGASTADVAIVLVDARHGLMEQTRRHTALAALLRVAHVVLAVNKMDLVDFSQETFDRIVAEFGELAAGLDVPSFQAIPLSALHGDNVVKHSPRLKWYTGPSLLEHLDTVSVESRSSGTQLRMSVQGVIRPRNAAYPDYRAYTGRIAAGELRVGQEIVVLPSGVRSTVEGIDTPDGSLDVASTGRSVAVRLSTEVDVARGDLLAAVEDVPEVTQTIRGRICVLADRVLRPGDRYGVRIGTREVRGAVVSMGDRWDAVTLTNSEAEHLFENDIGVVELRVSEPIALDTYESSPHTGSFLLVDDVNGATVAAGMALAS